MLIRRPLRNLPIEARPTTSVRATTKNSLMQLLKSSQEPLINEGSTDRPSSLLVSLLTVARCSRSHLGLSWNLHLEFAADYGRMTSHSEVIQPLLSHVVFDGRASVPIQIVSLWGSPQRFSDPAVPELYQNPIQLRSRGLLRARSRFPEIVENIKSAK